MVDNASCDEKIGLQVWKKTSTIKIKEILIKINNGFL